MGTARLRVLGRRATLGAVLGAMLLGTGCGGRGPKLVQVRGTVTLDGAPLTDGAVTFVSQASSAALGGGRIKEGTFQVALPPGTYKVQIAASRAVPGKSIPGMSGAPVLESVVPARYNSATTLTADVSGNAAELSFPLRTK